MKLSAQESPPTPNLPDRKVRSTEATLWVAVCPESRNYGFRSVKATLLSLALLVLPIQSFAQTSPFQTGATALQTNLLAIMTPVAVILVIVLGVMAMAGRIAWGWVIGAIAGITLAFGAPQIVTWIRGMFGV
jgi:type IV secretion system protein VirB2